MNKILIEIFVPSIEERFDVYIPKSIKFGEAKYLIIKTIVELSNNKFIYNKSSNLYDQKNGKLLNDDSYIDDLELYNGSTLLLI